MPSTLDILALPNVEFLAQGLDQPHLDGVCRKSHFRLTDSRNTGIFSVQFVQYNFQPFSHTTLLYLVQEKAFTDQDQLVGDILN